MASRNVQSWKKLAALKKAKNRLTCTPGTVNKIALIIHWCFKLAEKVLYSYILNEEKRIDRYYYRLSHDRDFAQCFVDENLRVNTLPEWILDAGCGRGRVPTALGLLGRSTVAFDINRHEMWDNSRHASFFVADITKMPFRNSSFELCTCLTVLSEVRDDVAALREIHRVLKPSGSLVIQVANRKNLKSALLRKKLYIRNVREYESDEMKHLLESTGFKVRSMRAMGFYSPVFTRLVNNLITAEMWLSFGRLLPEKYRGVIWLVCERYGLSSASTACFSVGNMKPPSLE